LLAARPSCLPYNYVSDAGEKPLAKNEKKIKKNDGAEY
jgi:hypothetical protein